MPRRALLVVNPTARGVPPPNELERATAALTARGWHLPIVWTSRAGEATELARQAAVDGAEAVVACGGDGTINEVVNGIAGTESALAVVRAGTADVWGRGVGLPRDPVRALELLESGCRRRVDLGRADGRHFLLMAGIGLDGQVTRAVPAGLKRRFGAVAYGVAGAREALRYRGSRAELVLDGEPLQPGREFFWIVVGNTRSYGGVVEITRRAFADDGLLDVCAFSGRSPGAMAAQLLRILAGRHLVSSHVCYRRTRQLEVRGPALAVQLDGEFAGETPMTFRAVPQALTVVLPPAGAPGLFCHPA